MGVGKELADLLDRQRDWTFSASHHQRLAGAVADVR